MVVEKASGWVWRILLVVTGWILMEIIAGIIHVWIIKKAKVCPYMEEAQRAKNASK